MALRTIGRGATRQQGDRTKPAMPDGTTPLERGERPINQSR